MTVDMGDTTFDISYNGGMHTASDAAILIRESGLLLTGDTMADCRLSDTPGSLASLSVLPGIVLDFNQEDQVVGVEILRVKNRVPLANLKQIQFEVA